MSWLTEKARRAFRPWVLAALFAVVLPLFPDYIAPFLAIASLLAAWRDIRARGDSFQLGPAGRVLLVYLALIALGILYSPQKVTSLGTVLMWAAAFAVCLAVENVLITGRRLSIALICLAVTASLIGALACAQYVLAALFHLPVSMQIWEPVDKAVLSLFPYDFILDIYGIRAAATFNNPNVCAEYLFMAAPFIAAYAFGGKPSRSRVLCGLLLLPLAAGLALTFSRGSYLALLTIIGVFFLFHLKKLWIFLIGGAAALLALPDAVVSRFLSIKTIDFAVKERFSVWQVITGHIAQRPLLGIGPGTYNTWALLREAGIDAPHAHNLALQLLAESGVAGLLVMGSAFAMLARSGFRLLREGNRTASRTVRLLGIAFLALTAALLVDGLVDFPLLTPRLTSTFALTAALADSASRIYLPPSLKTGFWSAVKEKIKRKQR
ncbi:MAG: hypothetical protein HFJ80_04810 [Clostridiales bacterium]|nr:hypothetical protein [Clostridiales bacterium]